MPDSTAPCVLFVDDEPSVTMAMQRALHGSPFEVLTASSAAEGLAILARGPVAVVVSDYRMPGMCGAEFLGIVRERHPDTVRLMLSGQADLASAVDAINRGGVFRFLLKPCQAEDVRLTIEAAFAARAEAADFRAWQETERGPAAAERGAALDAELGTVWMGFQPIVRASGEQYGYEALIRSSAPGWRGAHELCNAAASIGRQRDVERTVRRLVAARMPELPLGLTMLVNLHPDAIDDDELLAQDGVLSPFANRVVLEITERSALHEDADVIRNVAALRALGYRLAIDDMGAGYSGLTTFAIVVPELVKYDRELVREGPSSPTKARLIASMNSVCRELGVLTLAEGVETAREREFAVGLRCDLLQGYLFGAAQRDFCPPARSVPD